MEHIEEAGVHSGDSACAIPPPTLAAGDRRGASRTHTRALADALDVRGLLNVQYAVKDGQVFVIEANPRASRTVPFVSKATGVPLAKVAARVMVGATLAELRDEGLLRPPADGGHVAVKEAVLPVQPLPRRRHRARPRDALDRRGHGHRPLLRPGVRQEPDRARATGCPRRARCSSRSPTATRPPGSSRRAASPSSGFAIVGDRRHRRRARGATAFPVDDGRRQGRRGATGVDAVDLISSGKVDLVVNTPRGRGPRADGTHIRAAAIVHRVPCVTTVAAALAAAAGIAEWVATDLRVRSLQEHHEGSGDQLALPI